MKPTLKDTQVSLRLSSEVASAMKNAAKMEHLSLADFLTRLFQEREKQQDLESRLAALERVVFQQSQAA